MGSIVRASVRHDLGHSTEIPIRLWHNGDTVFERVMNAEVVYQYDPALGNPYWLTEGEVLAHHPVMGLFVADCVDLEFA
jgi:hypothetical protein